MVEDGRWALKSLQSPPPWAERPRLKWRACWESFLRWALADTPGLRALALAVWLGDARELPKGFAESYRAGGILHVLALSGQHFVSLLLLFKALQWGLAPWACRRRWLRRGLVAADSVLPLVAVLFLVGINPGNAPILRAGVLWGAVTCVRACGLVVGPVQMILSTIGILIVADPSSLAANSFLLSAAATAMLGWLLDAQTSQGWRLYVLVSLAMPVLVAPWVAFCFAKVSWLAPLHGLVWGGVWSLVWVPLGFLAPGLAFLPAGNWADAAWGVFAESQRVLAPVFGWGYASVWRPTWVEMGAAVWALGVLVERCVKTRRA